MDPPIMVSIIAAPLVVVVPRNVLIPATIAAVVAGRKGLRRNLPREG